MARTGGKSRFRKRTVLLVVLLAALAGSLSAMLVMRATANACTMCVEIITPLHALTQAAIISLVFARIDAMIELLVFFILPMHAGQTMGSAYGAQMLPVATISAQTKQLALLEKQVNTIGGHRDYVLSANFCQGTSGVRGLRSGFEGAETTLKALDVNFNDYLINAGSTQLEQLDERFGKRITRWCDYKEVYDLPESFFQPYYAAGYALDPANKAECYIKDGKRLCKCYEAKGEARDAHVWVNGDVRVGRHMWLNTTLVKPEEMGLMFDMVANLAAPLPEDPMEPALLEEPRGKMAHIRKVANTTRMNVAAHALNSLMADRMGVTPMKEWMLDLLVELGASEGAQDLVADNVSLHELMDMLMDKRFSARGWGLRTQNAPPGSLVRDTAQLTAFQLMMQWKTYELLERYLTVEATSLAMNVETARDKLLEEGDTTPVTSPGGEVRSGGGGGIFSIFGFE